MLAITLLGCLLVQAPQTAEFWEESAPLSFCNRTVGAALLDLDEDGYPEYLRLGVTPVSAQGLLGLTRGSAYGPVGPELCSFPTYYPESIGVKDIDADGRDDIFVVHRRIVAVNPPVTSVVPTLTLYLRSPSPSGAFASAFTTTRLDLSPGAELAAFGDFDQDGILDVASVGRAHRLFFQKGLGLVGGIPAYSSQFVDVSLAAAQTVGSPLPFQFGFASGIEVADFDGDGTDDIAVAATTAMGGGVHVFFQRPAGFAYQEVTFTSAGGGVLGASSLARGDFDHDGWTDLAVTVTGSDLHVLINAGPTNPALPANQALNLLDLPCSGVAVGASALQAADLDDDGTVDLACTDPLTSGVTIAYNRNSLSRGSFEPSHVIFVPAQGSGLRAISLADVDRDGDVDIAPSYTFSQSMDLLCSERIANSRKGRNVIALRGSLTQGAIGSSFVPDGDELVQGSPLVRSTRGAFRLASRFTFRADARAGDLLRIRLRDGTTGMSVSGALGLRDALTGQLVWVAQYAPAGVTEDRSFDVPGAGRFVSDHGQVELVWSHESSSGSFHSSLDQVSVELAP